jgi:DNA-binding response OmpR family regulator
MAAKVHLLDFIMPMIAEADIEKVSLVNMQELVSEVRSDPMGQWYLDRSNTHRHIDWADQVLEEPPGTYLADSSNANQADDQERLKIDLNQAVVYGPQGPVYLTPAETRLLACLARQPGVIVPHSVLSDIISQDHTGAVWTDPKYHIRNLRIKLGDNLQNPVIIKSRRGMGYYLDKKVKGLIWGKGELPAR